MRFPGPRAAWPNTRTVSVHRPGAGVVTLREDEPLDGGDVLPGFSRPVGEAFAAAAGPAR